MFELVDGEKKIQIAFGHYDSINVDNGAGELITVKHHTIDITNPLGGVASITSTVKGPCCLPLGFLKLNSFSWPSTFISLVNCMFFTYFNSIRGRFKANLRF